MSSFLWIITHHITPYELNQQLHMFHPWIFRSCGAPQFYFEACNALCQSIAVSHNTMWQEGSCDWFVGIYIPPKKRTHRYFGGCLKPPWFHSAEKSSTGNSSFMEGKPVNPARKIHLKHYFDTHTVHLWCENKRQINNNGTFRSFGPEKIRLRISQGELRYISVAKKSLWPSPWLLRGRFACHRSCWELLVNALVGEPIFERRSRPSWNHHFCRGEVLKLQGGKPHCWRRDLLTNNSGWWNVKYFFCSSLPWGRWSHFDGSHIFQLNWVGSTTN